MQPAHARDEEHRGERCGIDECRADVRLDEDEEDRGEPEGENPQHGARTGDAARAIGDEPGQREHEQHLAELGRLET